MKLKHSLLICISGGIAITSQTLNAQTFYQCIQCKSGTYATSTGCEPCPKGYYCTDGIKTACPEFQTTSSTGNSSSSACHIQEVKIYGKSVTSGVISTQYETIPVNHSAFTCDKNSFPKLFGTGGLTPSISGCVVSILGHYTYDIGKYGNGQYYNIVCDGIPCNEYHVEKVNTCSAGYYIPSGSTSCQPCGYGYYCSGGKRTGCPVNKTTTTTTASSSSACIDQYWGFRYKTSSGTSTLKYKIEQVGYCPIQSGCTFIDATGAIGGGAGGTYMGLCSTSGPCSHPTIIKYTPQ